MWCWVQKWNSKIDLRPFIVKKVVLKEKQSFNCGDCGKDFANNGNLKAHMVYHSDKRLFPCNKCKKAFKTKRDLVVYDITHRVETNPLSAPPVKRDFLKVPTCTHTWKGCMNWWSKSAMIVEKSLKQGLTLSLTFQAELKFVLSECVKKTKVKLAAKAVDFRQQSTISGCILEDQK